MNISPILINKFYNNNYRNNISFKTNYREVFNRQHKLLYRNTTCLLRDDLSWGNITQIINLVFKNANKINFFDFACSDGSEPVSFAIMIQEELKEFIPKIGQIKAYDIDENMINIAKSGCFNVMRLDITKLEYLFPNGYNHYLEIKPFNNKVDIYTTASVANNIMDMIHFEQGNILDKIDNLPPENNIVACRNFWSYLSEPKRNTLVQKIVQKLTFPNIVIIGAMEREIGINKVLEQNGFEEWALNIFVKIDKNKFR